MGVNVILILPGTIKMYRNVEIKMSTFVNKFKLCLQQNVLKV